MINHTNKTIVFKEISLRVKHLFSGLSSIPQPRIIKSIIRYRIPIPNDNNVVNQILVDEIEVPKNKAFKFQIELFKKYEEFEFEINGRKILNFIFKFNNQIQIELPKIFLNCLDENEKLEIYLLS